MSAFKKTIMVPGQPEIAKVNHKTGTLYLSTDIWRGLPEQEKLFVLFHEEGHLKLNTYDEFQANKYAVKKFVQIGAFNNKQLGQKIMVMRSILDKADGQTSSFTAGVGDVYGIGQGLQAVFSNLPVLGVGSKARAKEAEATAAANVSVLNAQAKAAAAKSKSTMTIVIIVSVLAIVGLAIFFILKRRKV